MDPGAANVPGAGGGADTTAIQVEKAGKVRADEAAKEYAATTSQQHEADQKKYATEVCCRTRRCCRGY